MQDEKIHANIAAEWPSVSGTFFPDKYQKKRMKTTGSYYRRDEKVEEYNYSKGEFV